MSGDQSPQMIGLSIKRLADESWRDCARRYGKANGLEHEITELFVSMVATGMPDDDAAWSAVYEWDCCDLHDEKKRPR